MNWKDILFPWAALRGADQDIDGLIELSFKQTKKIANLEQDISVQKERIKLLLKQNDDLDLKLRSARLANTILKADLKKLTAIIDDLPKHGKNGRLASKKDDGSSAEAPTTPSAEKS
jgi:hypothetical protein